MENKLKEGETLFTDGKIEEAEKLFLSVIEKDTNNDVRLSSVEAKEAYNNLGVIASRNDDVKSAIDFFTRSLEIDPFYKDAIINYTDLLRTLNQLHIAMPLLEKIAEMNPNDEEVIQHLEDIRPKPQTSAKITILCLPGCESFLGDIANFLKTKYEVRTCYTKNLQEIESAVDWADIIWLEWANEMAIYATHKLPSILQKKTLCRIHSYEVLAGYLPKVDWSKINTIIFVADHVRKIAQAIHPPISKTECHVINNGVNLHKFFFGKREPGLNLAIVGNINHKKNPAVWIEIMSRLVKLNTQYTLKVAGEFQDPRFKYYFENIIPKLGLDKNIRFFGRVKDIPGWFENERINYLLTTSVFESFGYGIAEAMSMGYKPLIYNFPNAEDIWPHNCVFKSIDELIAKLRDKKDYNSLEYHEFIKARYSLRLQLKRIESTLRDLNKEAHTQANTYNSQKERKTFSSRVPARINLHKPHRNLIITGIPRSGSSLFSVLINKIANTVCLNEIVYDVLSLPQAFEEIRKRLIRKEPIPNKYDSTGMLTTNTQDGTVNVEHKVVELVNEDIVIGSKVNIPYLNQIQTILEYGYNVIAIVRDPVYTIGSWNSKKTSHLSEAHVTKDNLSPRWAHIPFTTEDKIGRQAQIWQFYAKLIWSLRDRIKIYTYEQITSNTAWVLNDVCNHLGLKAPKKTNNLENLNIDSRYPMMAEIKEAVNRYCPISKEFGYSYGNSEEEICYPTKLTSAELSSGLAH